MRIALHGFARVGKDEVGKILVKNNNLKRCAFGDIIKADLDPMIQQHLGFSAFTENDSQKKMIRDVLVHWGYANYASIEKRFFDNLPERAVNTRIFRERECRLWKEQGGVIWLVQRPGYGPAEPKEAEELTACMAAGLIDDFINNDGSLESLELEVGFAVGRL